MTTLSTRGQDGPASRLLIHADDPGQANRLALLVSHYGHQPRILDTRQLLTPGWSRGRPARQLPTASAPRCASASLWPGLPRLCSASGWGDTQLALLRQGCAIGAPPCGEREPVEQWLRLARSQPRHGAGPDADRERAAPEAGGEAARRAGQGAADAPSGVGRGTGLSPDAQHRHEPSPEPGELARQLLLALPA